MNFDSITSYEKMFCNYNYKGDSVFKAKIKINTEGEISIIAVRTNNKLYSFKKNYKNLQDKEEEFLDDDEEDYDNSIEIDLDNKENFINPFYGSINDSLNTDFTPTPKNFNKNFSFNNINFTFNSIKSNNKDKFFLNKENIIDNCSICYLKFEDSNNILIIKNCKHIFHFECLNNWIDTKELNKNQCPYCKIKINSKIDI